MSVRRDLNPILLDSKSMTVRNFNPRIRSKRLLDTIENLARVVSIGVFLDGENSGLTRRDGTPILIAALDPGANPLINNNNLDGTCQKDNHQEDVDPATVDATLLGAMISRNAFAHVGGPYVTDKNGKINYNLNLRGYNLDGLPESREKDNYAGFDLYHEGDSGDAIIVLSSGSSTTTNVLPSGQTDTTINYEDGETMRMRITGIQQGSLTDRTILWERRVTDSAICAGGMPAVPAVWEPVFEVGGYV